MLLQEGGWWVVVVALAVAARTPARASSLLAMVVGSRVEND
jgi:hypothetical protein